MAEVTLIILVSDIKLTDYGYSKDCAITRAFARAKYPHISHVGGGQIWNDGLYRFFSIPELHNISIEVFEMYTNKNPKDLKDKAFQLSIPDEILATNLFESSLTTY